MSIYLEECVKCNPIGNKLTEEQAAAMQEHAILYGFAVYPTQTYCRKHFEEMYPKQNKEIEAVTISTTQGFEFIESPRARA